jgi:hypothetical protein
MYLLALQPFIYEQTLDIKFRNIHIYMKERNKVEGIQCLIKDISIFRSYFF